MSHPDMKAALFKKAHHKQLLLVTIFGAVVFLPGCASLSNGGRQLIALKTESTTGNSIEGVSCELTNSSGKWSVKTPGTVQVRRSASAIQINCEDEQWGMDSSFAAKSEGKYMQSIAGGGVGGFGVGAVVGLVLGNEGLLLEATVGGGIFGIVPGIIIGPTVDTLTGAIYEYPSEITLTVKPRSSLAPADTVK